MGEKGMRNKAGIIKYIGNRIAMLICIFDYQFSYFSIFAGYKASALMSLYIQGDVKYSQRL
jgi:hypothetical protein